MNRRRFLAGASLSTGALAVSPAAPASPREPPSVPTGRPAPGAFEGWNERARLNALGRDWRVVEDLRVPDGALAFVDMTGEALVLTKRLEPVASQAMVAYLGLDLKMVALSGPDLLADRLLAHGGDPREAEVRDAAPPCASVFKPADIGPRLPWTTFVGARRPADTMPVTLKGSTRTYHVDQIVRRLGSDDDLVARRREGLLGGDAPCVVKVFDLGGGRRCEVVVFGDVEANDRFIVQTWHRTSIIDAGEAVEVAYAHSYPACPGVREAPRSDDFYRALLVFTATWRAELDLTATLVLPDRSWADLVRHAFAKEIMTRPDGVYPRYGAVDRDYAGSEYDGFQDTFTSSLSANLEWGRLAQARAVLDGYFTDFVRADGAINMRGPEIGQFGLTLSLLARYLHLTNDAALLTHHAGKIAATASILTRLHDAALTLPAADPGCGLLHGWNESDSCLFPDPSTWLRPYFANSALAARGLGDLAAVWPRIAPDGRKASTDWASRARVLRARVEAAVRASLRHDLSPPYAPPLPGVQLTFRQSLAQEQPSPQQWPHRAYAELLHAGVLPDDLANIVVDSMRGHGATSLGVVANIGPLSPDSRDILGFISYGYARALLKLDRVEEYILFLYSHRHHVHTPGSWTAGEVCDISGGLPLFCMPAQMTAPLLIRWMLVWEEEDAERLHLARALPRDWLGSGRQVAITGAPTRWGEADLRLEADAAAGRLTGRVDLRGPRRPRETWLRLRVPDGAQLDDLTVNGRPEPLAGPRGDSIRLDSAGSIFEIKARYAVRAIVNPTAASGAHEASSA